MSPSVVRALLAAQMPDLSHLPLRRMPPVGTDNLLFRLGDFVLRFPRHAAAEAQIGGAMPEVSFPIPRLRRVGEASEAFPRAWAVVDWLPGRVPGVLDRGMARDLAGWVAELRALPPVGPERVFVVDAQALRAQVPGVVEAAPGDLFRLIERAEAAGPVPARVLQHGDLHVLNLLVRRGHMAGVLDWGTLAVGDGTADLLPAFMAMEPDAAEAYLTALGASAAEVERAFALALQKCLAGLPYYRQTNPGFHAVLRATLSRLLAVSTFP